MLTELDLNLLNALQALLSERHVTRAGQRVGLSQPAMSAALARLRRYFDDELLVREGNRYSLTPLAEQLVDPLDEMTRQIERALVLRTGFDPTTSEREFAIQLSDYATFVLMRPLLALVASEAPHVRIRFEGIELAPASINQSIDLLVAPPILATAEEHVPLWSDRWVVAVSDDHPEVQDTITLEQLASLPYIRFQAFRVRNPADTQLADLGIDPRVSGTIASYTGALFMVGGTRAFTLAPSRLAARFASLAGARVLDCPVPLDPLEEHLHWDATRAHEAGTAWLRDLVRKVASEL